MAWSRAFDDPIPHPDGGTIRTLRQAAHLMLALSKRDAASGHWQLALHCLIAAAEGRGPLLHARIAMLRALHHDRPAPTVPRIKRAKAFTLVR